MTILRFIFIAIVLCRMVQAYPGVLKTYPAPTGAELLGMYRVEVSADNNRWHTVPTYAVKVDKVENARHNVRKVSMAYFDFEGDVRVRVTKLNGAFTAARIRPLSYNIGFERCDSTIEFTLNRPANLSIEFDGELFNNLHLFANPMLKDKPKMRDKHTVYFGPGIHRLVGDTLAVKSGTTVWIDGGAIVKGTLKISDAKNVKVMGRGEIHPDGRGPGIEIARSRGVSVDGIITTQCPVGGSDGVKITNVKTISSYGWGDGLNVFASSNVLWNGVFCRTSDDCTTVYATRKGFTGGCKNITMLNSTLWADVAHPIFIGLHGNTERPDTIENVRYENIDILDENEFQLDYQGCMAINAGDDNLVRDIVFKDIRIENIRRGQILSLRVSFNKKYCKAPGRGIENVLFKNITYTGTQPEVALIIGYDSLRKVKNVTFDNFTINEKRIYDDMPDKPKWYKTADMGRIFIGENVENVVFK